MRAFSRTQRSGKQATHAEFEKALVKALPESFEIPDTMCDGVTRRFAAMLADMKERGTTEAKLKELITPEKYERYRKISRPQVEAQLRGRLRSGRSRRRRASRCRRMRLMTR